MGAGDEVIFGMVVCAKPNAAVSGANNCKPFTMANQQGEQQEEKGVEEYSVK